MKFSDLLDQITQKNNSLVCVGLDSDISKIPKHLQNLTQPIFEFNKRIIDSTHELVCAYKPNTAFYESEGVGGIEQLKMTVDYLKDKYPHIPVIIDAKRGDIGNTNSGYTKFVFDYLHADGVTVHPYLGKEALLPFLERADKGIFVLCKTSNPGAGEFQDLILSGQMLFEYVAQKVFEDWNGNNNCGLVVGAPYPTQLKIVRHMVGNMPLLIPGVGAQGGDLEKTVLAGIDTNGKNAIINSSRGIIFASEGEDFAEKARNETQKLRDMINLFRRKV